MAAPKSFTLDDGERYYVGADIGQFLKFHRGTLYKKYPSLWKRFATPEEKKKIQDMGCATSCVTSSIMLVKANEIDDILGGGDDGKYRLPGSQSSTPKLDAMNATTPGKLRPRVVSYVEQQTSSASIYRAPVPSCVPHAYARANVSTGSTTEETDYPSLLRNANEPVELVPIRLDMEVEGVKLRDFFCYNKNERLITPEVLAQSVCDDLDLPDSFVLAVAQSIQQQLEVFEQLPPIDDAAVDQRAVVKLNVNVGNQTLIDQFEWDMSDAASNPEMFADKLCSDVGLGGEFQSAIAYSIRGQLMWNRQSYAYSDTPLPTVDCPFRSAAEANMWGPLLERLSESEIERKMRDQDRSTRRMRRLATSNPYGAL